MEVIRIAVEVSNDTASSMRAKEAEPFETMAFETTIVFGTDLYVKETLPCGFTLIGYPDKIEFDKVKTFILEMFDTYFDLSADLVTITVTAVSEELPEKEAAWQIETTPSLKEEKPQNETPTLNYVKAKRSNKTMITPLTALETEFDEKLAALVGAQEFKALCRELLKVSPMVKETLTFDCLKKQAFLFAINDGCGHTTAVDLLFSLYRSAQVLMMSTYGNATEIKLTQPTSTVLDPFAQVYEILDEGNHAQIKFLSIDISEWISQLKAPEFKAFLKKASKAVGHIIVFRIPFVDKEVLRTVSDTLNDVFFVRTVTFPPLSPKETREVAEKAIAKYGFSVEEDAWPYFDIKIAEEKSDGRFYGINTIYKVIRELLYGKQLSSVVKNEDDRLITKEDMSAICHNKTREKTADEMFASLVGADAIRTRVNEIISQIMLAKKQNMDAPCIHMRFVGNPGTGKTTVARILGKLLTEKGVLRVGGFYEYFGRDLVGRYIGETAPRTAEICRDAYGSILFIDEAYTLYRETDNPRDFGREALDTLIGEMENHRSDFLVIMAGYTDDMNFMLKANAGLASRMPYTIEFPNFTRDELYQIFEKMATKSFACEHELLCAAREFFDSLPNSLLESKEFSNGRFVRNLYERVWAKASMRTQLDEADAVVLKKVDFELSVADGEFKVINQKKKKNPIGFMP